MVNGNHTYSQSGSYSITVTLHHDSAADAVVTSAANVTDPGGSPFGGHLFFGLGGTIAPASHTTDSMSLPALDTWIIELLTVQQLPSDNPRSLPAVPMDQPALVPDASDRPAQGLDDDVMNLAQFA